MNAPRALISNVGSAVEVPVKWGVWTGDDLRTYELTCRVCVDLVPKSKLRFVASVQA